MVHILNDKSYLFLIGYQLAIISAQCDQKWTEVEAMALILWFFFSLALNLLSKSHQMTNVFGSKSQIFH